VCCQQPTSEWSDKSTMNKITEYMFFGLPIVAFDLTETRVSAQTAAVYAKANSERDLAKQIDWSVFRCRCRIPSEAFPIGPGGTLPRL
jgi:hypothetical protein